MRLQVVIQQTLPDLRKMRHQGEEQRARQFFTPTISQNRERLLQADIAQAFFEQMVELARQHDLLSDEQFTVDGTLIEAWAGQKSFKKKQGASPKPPADDTGNPSMDFRGEKRTNDTHASTTDRDARLFKKTQGQEAKLGLSGTPLGGEPQRLGREHAVDPGHPARRNGRPRWPWPRRFPG